MRISGISLKNTPAFHSGSIYVKDNCMHPPSTSCIITGYRNNGNTLLGWNFFQNDPAFGGEVKFDECGYFVCDTWWENTDTLLFEKMLCQDDATTCLMDGWGCALEYFKKLSEKETEPVSAEITEKYNTLANLFAKEKQLAEQIWSLLGGWDNMEQRPAKLAEKAVHEKACEYIREIEKLEKQSLSVLQELVTE